MEYIAAMPADTMSQASAARTYAVGDLHGRLDLLRLAVDAIAGHVRDAPFRVVFLGDYVDRGPESRGVVEFLIDLQQRWPVICLKGNHEALMVQAVTQPGGGRLEHWLENGGGATLRSYGVDPDGDLGGVPLQHIRWMSGLPRTTGDGHRIYVHAGVEPGVPIERQKEQTLLWIRERFLQARPGSFDAHIVHGHTPIWEGKPDPSEPELLPHRTNLDTGAFATGVLAIAVFDAETAGGPVDMIWIRGEARGSLVLPPEDDEPKVNAPGRRKRLADWFGRR
jgi:serine/threonine protein phosphatase 1